jgi:glycine dehydrogenase subunit 1
MDYLPHTDEDRRVMLDRLGLSSTDDLFAELPKKLLDPVIDLPPALDEPAILRSLEKITAPDIVSFLGAGAYDTHIPAIVGNMIGRTEFETAYTPYQPEISQGTLTAIYEFQSAITRLTGLPVANASMYDGASAVAEAAALAVRSVRKAHRVLISRGLHPLYRQTIETYIADLGCDKGTCASLEEIPLTVDGLTNLTALGEMLDEKVAAVIIATPNFLGMVEDLTAAFELTHDQCKGITIAVGSPLAQALLKPPAECGADIAVGEAQPLAATLSFGGPYLGYFSATKKLARKIPGRLVGQTVDADGSTCYALTLQTREQHIRREKATSNICTNNALMALAATIHLSALGPQGLTELATLNLQNAHYAADELTKLDGVEPLFPIGYFFNEFALKLPAGRVDEVIENLTERGYLPGLALKRFYPEYADGLLVAVTDKRTKDEIDGLVAALKEVL